MRTALLIAAVVVAVALGGEWYFHNQQAQAIARYEQNFRAYSADLGDPAARRLWYQVLAHRPPTQNQQRWTAAEGDVLNQIWQQLSRDFVHHPDGGQVLIPSDEMYRHPRLQGQSQRFADDQGNITLAPHNMPSIFEDLFAQ